VSSTVRTLLPSPDVSLFDARLIGHCASLRERSAHGVVHAGSLARAARKDVGVETAIVVVKKDEQEAALCVSLEAVGRRGGCALVNELEKGETSNGWTCQRACASWMS
jgi:hypothetical protein